MTHSTTSPTTGKVRLRTHPDAEWPTRALGQKTRATLRRMAGGDRLRWYALVLQHGIAVKAITIP